MKKSRLELIPSEYEFSDPLSTLCSLTSDETIERFKRAQFRSSHRLFQNIDESKRYIKP